MKKMYLVYLVFFLAGSLYGYSQLPADKIMEEARKTEQAESIKIRRFMMSMGKLFGGVSNMPVVKGIHSMEIVDFSDCHPQVRTEVYSRFSDIQDGNGYETLMVVKEDNELTHFIIKKDTKNTIREILILCLEEKDPTIIKLSGKIKEKDIAKLIEEYNK